MRLSANARRICRSIPVAKKSSPAVVWAIMIRTVESAPEVGSMVALAKV